MVAGCRKSPPPLALRVTEIALSSELDWAAVPAGEAQVSDAELLELTEKGLRRAGILVARAPEPGATEPVGSEAARLGRGPGDFRLRVTVQLAPARRPPAAPPGEPEAAPPVPRLLIGAALELLAFSTSRTRITAAEDASSAAPLAPELRRFEHLALAEKKLGPSSSPSSSSSPSPSPSGTGSPSPSVAQLLRRVVEESAYAIGSQLQLLTRRTEDLKRVAADKSADSALRRVAITLLGLRKERSAVPILIEVVKDRSPPRDLESTALAMALRDAALGALIEIGDQSAVRPLLDTVSFRERAEMTKLLEAAAALGGDEARRYLSFVSKSHPEPTLREAAKTALEHLERRASQKAARPDEPKAGEGNGAGGEGSGP